MSTVFFNFDDKLLREVPDFCAAHLLRLSFSFCLLPGDLRLRFQISTRENTSKSGIRTEYSKYYFDSISDVTQRVIYFE